MSDGKRSTLPITSDNIAELCQRYDTNADGPIGIYQLLTKLGSLGYTVAFDGDQIVSSRQQGIREDAEGEVIDLTAEGYTMRKCLAEEYNCSYPDGTSKIDKVCIKNETVKGGAKKKSKKKNGE